MNNKWIHTIGGLILGGITPIVLSIGIAAAQGVGMKSFLWTLFNFNGFYNSYFQLGIAANIGIFFLLMKKESTLNFSRGWLIATLLMTTWSVFIELRWL